MPLYEYGCACGAAQELVREIDDRDQPVECAGCGEQMRRLISPSAFGKPAFRMQAILSNGQRLAGNFGQRPKLDPPMKRVRSVK
jgi:putative FmdB family regulatory protein